MSTSAGTLTIDIAAGIARLEADMKKAAKDVRGAMSQIGGSVSTVKRGIAGLAAAIGVGSFAVLIKNAMESVDATAKLSDRLGIATDKMTGLQHASDLAGVSNQTLNTGLRGMVNIVAQAAQGLGDGSRAFQQLNLSARELSALAPDQQLERIMTSLAGVENVTQRNALAQQIFGARASEMLNLVADGTDGIRKATEDAKAWGLALDRVDSAKIEMANDAMTRAKGAFGGIVNTLAVQLSPIITALGNQFADSAKEAGGFKDIVINGMEKVALVVAYGANVVRGLQVVWLALKLVVAEVINFIIQSSTAAQIKLQDFFNTIGQSWVGKKMGVPVLEYANALQDVADVSKNGVQEIRGELEALASKKLPADGVLAWFAEVKEASQKGAEEIAAARAKAMGGGDAITPAVKGGFSGQDKLADNIAKMQESFATEQEVLAEQLMQKQMLLENAYMLDVISLQTYEEMKANLETQYQDKRSKAADQWRAREYGAQSSWMAQSNQLMQGSFNQQLQGTSIMLGQMGNLMQSNKKKEFEAGKKAAIGQALVNTYLGVSAALSYGFPIGLVFAAIALATGLANVNRIRSQQFGSGGGATPVFNASPGGGTPDPIDYTRSEPPAPSLVNQAAAVSQPRNVNLTIESDTGMVSMAWIRDKLIPGLNEAVGDGVNLRTMAA
jgi:hypothetical protein